MRDYLTAMNDFEYPRTVMETLHGQLTALNACVECCDRHALPGRIALFWEGREASSATYTFTELQDKSARFANFLLAQGVTQGDKVAGLLPRNVELLIVALAAWRIGAIYQPLFTAFGPKAIEHRLNSSGAAVVITGMTTDGSTGSRADSCSSSHPISVATSGATLGEGGNTAGSSAGSLSMMVRRVLMVVPCLA